MIRSLIVRLADWCYTCMRPKAFCDRYGCGFRGCGGAR